MASLDIGEFRYNIPNVCNLRFFLDEYLIPTGNWTSLREWLEHVTESDEKTKILSFFQTRALPNVDTMLIDGIAANQGLDAKIRGGALVKDSNKTNLETYNCEPTLHPKPQEWAWRAKKQIYQPAFVLNHFVHYSVVTRNMLDNPTESSPRFVERKPFERRVDELNEVNDMLIMMMEITSLTFHFDHSTLLNHAGLHASHQDHCTRPDKKLVGKMHPSRGRFSVKILQCWNTFKANSR